MSRSVPPARPGPDRTWAVLRQRCPRCRQGRVFRSTLAMHETCPHCGLRYAREPGYFLGAMYYSYGMGTIVLGLLTLLVWWMFLPAWAFHEVVPVAVLPFLFFVPAIFRYSRVLWLHFDHTFDPLEKE